MPDDRLVLDFMNTLVRDGDSLQDAQTAGRWWSARSCEPERATFSEQDVARLRRVRALLGEMLDARSPAAIRGINELLAAQRLVPRLCEDESIVLDLDVTDKDAGEVVVGQVLASLQVLAEGVGLSSVRMCAASDCVVRFSTTNSRRRWCSSDGCGNRTRVRRHYQRRQNADTGA